MKKEKYTKEPYRLRKETLRKVSEAVSFLKRRDETHWRKERQ